MEGVAPLARRIRLLGGGLIVGTALGVVIGWTLPPSGLPIAEAVAGASAPQAAPYSRYQKLTSFARSLALIEREYVVPVDGEALVEGAMRGMVDSLDPHTTYLPPDEAKMLMQDIDGTFGGVGIIVSLRAAENGRLQLEILEVLEGGPAATRALQVGDVIVSIEGRPVAEYVDLFEAIATMRGPVGSQVRFTVEREGEEPREISVARAKIESEAVRFERAEDDVGIIRLRDFQAQSTSEIRAALKAMEAGRKGGISALVLDLRDNGGGLLGEAIGVADLFLRRGVIVKTRGREGVLMSEARASSPGTYAKIPLVVLINKGSASASEIVAAALQDHGRAAIVGERSYGKGSVQSPHYLPNGGVLKLTTALYYSPNDRVIQAVGVMPDVVADGTPVGGVDTRPEIVPEDQVDGHLDPADFGHVKDAPPRESVEEPAAEPSRSEMTSGEEGSRSAREAAEATQLQAAIAQVKVIRKLQ